MPYTDVSQLPEHIKKYSPIAQRQWMHVWMTVYKSTQDEKRAFEAANSVLTKRMSNEKHFDHSDNFNHTVNKWLGIFK